MQCCTKPSGDTRTDFYFLSIMGYAAIFEYGSCTALQRFHQHKRCQRAESETRSAGKGDHGASVVPVKNPTGYSDTSNSNSQPEQRNVQHSNTTSTAAWACNNAPKWRGQGSRAVHGCQRDEVAVCDTQHQVEDQRKRIQPAA